MRFSDLVRPEGFAWDKTLSAAIAITGVLLIALFVHWLAARVIDRTIERSIALHSKRPGRSQARHAQRSRAIGSMLKSIVAGIIIAVTITTVLARLDYNIAPIIASAGVVGVALGFGAQNLVKDVLAGLFLIIEDQYGIGDTIEVLEVSGTVESVGLRVTRLHDAKGTVWYVRNGEILKVGNRSQARREDA